MLLLQTHSKTFIKMSDKFKKKLIFFIFCSLTFSDNISSVYLFLYVFVWHIEVLLYKPFFKVLFRIMLFMADLMKCEEQKKKTKKIYLRCAMVESNHFFFFSILFEIVFYLDKENETHAILTLLMSSIMKCLAKCKKKYLY